MKIDNIACSINNDTYSLNDLIAVMQALRTPVTGCPWDLEQDFKSILPYTIEEAYEVADAIDKGDMAELKEELGDLLFQSVYHAQMASEQGSFSIHDVIHEVTHKMISRHPHVFADQNAQNAQDVDAIWETQKNKENKTRKAESALDGVAHALPSLLRAQKLQKKAAKVGFSWKNVDDIFEKLDEEIAELKEAIKSGNFKHQSEELGDVLFVVANIGRILDINAEEATRQCNQKFERRFKGMEKDVSDRSMNLSELSLQELTECWNAQKFKEK